MCSLTSKRLNFSNLIQGGIDSRQNRPHIDGERDHYRQCSRFRERKVVIKPVMLPNDFS